MRAKLTPAVATAILLCTAGSLAAGGNPWLAIPGPQFSVPVPQIVPDRGQVVNTPQGPVITTGRAGLMQTTTLPGRPGQGLLQDNGNGTSQFTGPNGSATVPSPR